MDSAQFTQTDSDVDKVTHRNGIINPFTWIKGEATFVCFKQSGQLDDITTVSFSKEKAAPKDRPSVYDVNEDYSPS